MKEAFKKLNEEIKAEILATTKEFVQMTKESAEASGTFKFIISTDDVDRQGEVVDQKGWELDNYMANPIVLWAHDYKALPIGIATSIKQEGNKLVAEGVFAPEEANPFAQQVRKLYDLGILRTTSVGFIAKEMQKNVITRAELLEFSVVPVPANAQALRINTMKEAGVDLEMMAMKGLELKDVEEEPKEEETVLEKEPVEVVDSLENVVEEEATPPVEPGEKGAVSDMLDARNNLTWDDIEKKYGKLDGVYAILGAFCSVYLDDRLAVDQFEPLFAEALVLLEAYAKDPEGAKSNESEVGKALTAKSGNLLAILNKQNTVLSLKAGKVLSEKNRTTIQTAIEGMKAGIAALEELLKATEGDEGEKGNGASQKIKRSSDAGPDEMEGLKSFLQTREVLREINTVTSNALANFNKKAKAKK